MKIKKNSLTRTFIKRAILIVGGVILFFGIFYKYLFPTYYYWKLEQPVKDAEKIIQQQKQQELSSEILVLKVEKYSELSSEELNEHLDTQLKNKRYALNKFWITCETIEMVNQGQSIQRLYKQGSQKTDFYSRYFQIDDTFYVVGTSIPSFREVTSVILPLIIFTLFFILILLIIVLFYSVRKNIIEPIENLEMLTRKISKRDFSKINLREENELSLLTESINEMSQSLQLYERNLLNKNDKLKNFARNIAHELKTPLSILQLLINSQEMGIKNENFTTELNTQVRHINELIERILEFSQQEKDQIVFETISVNHLLEEEAQRISFIDPDFKCNMDIQNFEIQTSLPHFQIILQNIFSNALKYSKDESVFINGCIHKGYLILKFKNKSKVYSEKDLNRILDAFEVGDISRNQKLSGTGLGFSIIEQALRSLNGAFYVKQQSEVFIVKLVLPIKTSA
ncbi:HAMP domain-containing sensor histidine kinase [Lactococcus petauri]|uniref:HAMP domain-containing sensor histidine kinase n=1 Tax=Lactococcus petauri TaxID=1940789 RepID=UPI003851C3D4